MGMTREEQLMQKHELTKQVQAMNLEAKRSKILLDLANSDKGRESIKCKESGANLYATQFNCSNPKIMK